MKTIAGALSADETLSSTNVGKGGFLQKILVHVISIVCGFINLRVDVYGKVKTHTLSCVTVQLLDQICYQRLFVTPSTYISQVW